jgi:hypothetical protein
MTQLHLSHHLSGEFIEKTLDGKIIAEGQTITCAHCGIVWQVKPGSGRERGWCLRCGGPTCGSKACTERCVPYERQMEIMERRARLLEYIENNFGSRS